MAKKPAKASAQADDTDFLLHSLQDAFEARVAPDPAVQQCYRVSPGPDFMLVAHTPDMPAYRDLAQRLFTSDANVRNVKAFFSVKRAKFAPHLPLHRVPH